jgi:hypothetical protein
MDHHPLRYLQTQPHLSKRQKRWLNALAEYDYTIKYLAGKWNVVADALSRRAIGRPSLLWHKKWGARGLPCADTVTGLAGHWYGCVFLFRAPPVGCAVSCQAGRWRWYVRGRRSSLTRRRSLSPGK